MQHGDADAQDYTDSLDQLAANERAIESLYREYARQHPAQKGFWLGLASEEELHAASIEELAAAAGHPAATPSKRFKTEAIRAFTAYVQEQEEAARRGEVTFETALTMAYYIETALIERGFFEQLPHHDADTAKTLTALKSDTERHVSKVIEARAGLHRP